MPELKVTRELHAAVRETLKIKGIMSAAKHHELSPQTVSRIKRGGRSYLGYKRALNDDHNIHLKQRRASNTQYLDFPTKLRVSPPKRGLLDRIRRRRGE